MRTEYFISDDGRELKCMLWDNVAHPIGVVQIIHGMTEHIRQYNKFAKTLNKNGYIVFGTARGDMRRGANRKIFEIGMPGHANDIFAATVSDQHEIMAWLAKKYDLPVFLFGHSYGSFVAQRIIEESDTATAGVCLAATSKYPTWKLRLGQMIAWCGIHIFGPDARTRVLRRLAPVRRVAHSWAFYFSLFKNLGRLRGMASAELPLLIISSEQDPISMNGRLARKLYKMYERHGMKNLTIIVYPESGANAGIDIDAPQLQNDIVEFLNSVCYGK